MWFNFKTGQYEEQEYLSPPMDKIHEYIPQGEITQNYYRCLLSQGIPYLDAVERVLECFMKGGL